MKHWHRFKTLFLMRSWDIPEREIRVLYLHPVREEFPYQKAA